MPPISPDRWRVLSPYLDEALDLATDQRGDWLAAISSRDAVLEQRFMDRAVLDPQSALPTSLAGQVLGAYRLVSQIGQ
jgi:hypothetical protein